MGAKTEVEFMPGAVLVRGSEGGANRTPLLKMIGAIAAGSAKKAFSAQKRGKIKWLQRGGGAGTPNQVKNMAGLLSDLARSGNVKSRRFQSRPAGIDTGTLRRSIAYRVLGDGAVEIGSTLPYASKMQEGGEISVEITPKIRTNLAKLLRKRTDLREELGWLFQADRYEAEQPARPFIIWTEDDQKKVVREVVRFFTTGGGR